MNRIFVQIAISLAVGAFVGLSFGAGLFAGAERFLGDRLYSEKLVDSRIAIVAIDDDSISKIGQWPWPREVFANLITELQRSGAKAVAIDVVFAENSRLGEEDDLKLEQALKDAKIPVILPLEASTIRIEKNGVQAVNIVSTLPRFSSQSTVKIGHVSLIADPDGVVRTFPRKLKVNDQELTSLSAVTLSSLNLNFTEPDSITPRIVYAGPPGRVKAIPVYKVLGQTADKDLKDKIVFVGATAPDLHDTKITPMSRGSEMSGVEIQAQIANMLLSGFNYKQIDTPLWAVTVFVSVMLCALAFILFKKLRFIVPFVASFAIAVLIVSIILFQQGVVVPLLHWEAAVLLTSLALFAFRYFITDRDKRMTKQIFGKYVSKDVLDHLMKDPDKVKLGGDTKELTVFFSDIRGFTTISEKLHPQELVRVLNKYFNAMTSLVLKNGGVVDKFIGDAIMAFWGAPIDDPDRADRALKTSIEMVHALEKLNADLRRVGDPEIDIGIGLFSGPAVVGNVGSNDRFDYTAMGDTVNAASRLEGMNKNYGTKIILSQSTVDLLKGSYPIKFLDEAQVKGRAEPIKLYTIDFESLNNKTA